MGVFRSVSEFFHEGVALTEGWQQFSCQAGQYEDPEAIAEELWEPSQGATVGAHLRARGQLKRQVDQTFDALDHFYRIAFTGSASLVAPQAGKRLLLVCDGLATIATLWFNGVVLGRTENMYRRHAFDVTELLAPDNTLVLRFDALLPWLKLKKGPRRWPTRLVTERNLRFVRTSLLGRMPGWTPPWPIVGPFRAVRLVSVETVVLECAKCVPELDATGAYVDFDVRFCLPNEGSAKPRLSCEVAGHTVEVTLHQDGASFRGTCRVPVADAQPWWPHTHGEQPLYAASVRVSLDGTTSSFELGRIGFRKVELRASAHFGFRINEVDVFCRGACWAPLDVVSLSASPGALRDALEQVKAGGMNLLRLSGTLAYEVPEFHALCDELGILVWQDFMFANMDYPRGDASFDTEVSLEVEQILERLSPRCSSVLFCGGSETEQQAAMMGLPLEECRHPLWREQLPTLLKQWGCAIPYWYSTPGGEGLPFWPHDGCTHYYGVGAYLRPLEDARVAGVRFASECLAFAGPPENAATDLTLRQRVPQDNGASWTFADVTRHYVGEFFGAQSLPLEEHDASSYAQLAARAVAYAMHQTQTHFRDPLSPCAGSLIWMLRDLEPGWGWGIIASDGRPKSGYHALKRIWAPQAVWFVDEGLSGLTVVVANDPGRALSAQLVLTLSHESGATIEEIVREVQVPAHSALRFRVEQLAGRFLDTSDAYRFGPPTFATIHARLLSAGNLISEECRSITRPFKLDAGRAAGPSEGAR
ncbi:MAG TPA: hypothetical protein VHM70_14185 [Polyangiaceae bacterium]|nr:hypothetical protein [Polyangiaceae bacterium]